MRKFIFVVFLLVFFVCDINAKKQNTFERQRRYIGLSLSTLYFVELKDNGLKRIYPLIGISYFISKHVEIKASFLKYYFSLLCKRSFLNGRFSPFIAIGPSVNEDLEVEYKYKLFTSFSFGLDYFHTDRLSSSIGFSLHYNRDLKLKAYDISLQLIEFHI